MRLSTFDPHELRDLELGPLSLGEAAVGIGAGATEHAEPEGRRSRLASRVGAHREMDVRARGDRFELVLEIQVRGHLEAVDLGDDLTHLKRRGRR